MRISDSISKPALRPMKSYNDLCCSGGFDTNRHLSKYFSQSLSMENVTSWQHQHHESTNESKNLLKLSNMSLNTFGHLLKNRNSRPEVELERRSFFNRVFSLSNEIESETLCFMIKAFRMCALMLPPSSKRKLHLLLRFLYKLRYDQHSCKHLVETVESTKATTKKQVST